MSHSSRFLRFFAGLVFACALAHSAFGQESLPPKPDRYFSDRAGVVDLETANRLNHELADFERETSDQLLVAIFQKIPDGFERDDFTVKTAHAWSVGRRDRNNGAILFIFVNDRQVRIEVGYGLEPVLTDATCSLIIRREIAPAFRQGDYARGVDSAVHAMMQACRGEYHGTGRTLADSSLHGISSWMVGTFVGILLLLGWVTRRRSYGYGRSYDTGGTWFIGGDSGSSSSSSSSDSFSGGGGDFGGGGSGGSW